MYEGDQKTILAVKSDDNGKLTDLDVDADIEIKEIIKKWKV
jgi:hypothetical protein